MQRDLSIPLILVTEPTPTKAKTTSSKPPARTKLSTPYRLSRLRSLLLNPTASSDPPLFLLVDPLRKTHFRFTRSVPASETHCFDLSIGDIVTRQPPGLSKSHGVADSRRTRTTPSPIYSFSGCAHLVPADATEELTPIEAWTFQLAYHLPSEAITTTFGKELALIKQETCVDLVKRAFLQHLFEVDLIEECRRKRREKRKADAEEEMGAGYAVPSVRSIVSGLRAPPPTATRACFEDRAIPYPAREITTSDPSSTGISTSNSAVSAILDGASDRLREYLEKQRTDSKSHHTQHAAQPAFPQNPFDGTKQSAQILVAPAIPERNALRTLPGHKPKPKPLNLANLRSQDDFDREIRRLPAAYNVRIEEVMQAQTQTRDRNPILYPQIGHRREWEVQKNEVSGERGVSGKSGGNRVGEDGGAFWKALGRLLGVSGMWDRP